MPTESPILYRSNLPAGVEVQYRSGRVIIATELGGQIALDKKLFALYQWAQGRSMDEILGSFSSEKTRVDSSSQHAEILRAALACLVQADLLQRETSRQPGGEDALPPAPRTGSALVSIIIINYNSQDWLEECLLSLQAQTYQPIEVIILDNGSAEDPTGWLNKSSPSVKALRLESPLGLAAAINRAVAAARGHYFFFLNPDVRLDPQAVVELVATAEEQDASTYAGIAPKLRYWWAPGFLNGLGNRVGFSSWGADNAQGHLDLGQFDAWSDLPSLCFAAALVPRAAWEAVGALDEGFPLYYEDAEWSYRARLLGHRLKLAPRAIVYHAMGRRFHTNTDTDLTPTKLSRVTYGRLRFAAKILSVKNLCRVLLTNAVEDLGRMTLNLLRGRLRHLTATVTGWRMFLGHLSELRLLRRQLQSQRALSDRLIFELQRSIPPALIWRGLPELSWDIIQHEYLPVMKSKKTFPIPELSSSPHLLIISQDIVAEKMAGIGLRYLEMARALSSHLEVTLAAPGENSPALLQPPDTSALHLTTYQFEHPQYLRELAGNSDIILLSSFILDKFPFLADRVIGTRRPRRVIDLYDPIVLENLHYYQSEPTELQNSLNRQAVESMNRLVKSGDFFICGNERQRDFWLGVLAANGRLNPQTFSQDASLRRLIDVVGVGFPDRQPNHQPLLRGVHPGFPQNTKIVLWGGGIWDWLDPLSLVKAWPQVLQQHPQARLVFLGTRHPNPLVPRHQLAAQTEALAAACGEKNKTIFFFEWLSLPDRESLLCEADVGVALHPLHVETRYAIRTRILDYFWARLPVLVSDGDITSEWVHQFGLGRVVPPLDVAAIAAALHDLLRAPKDSYLQAFAPLRDTFSWPSVIQPLLRYCLEGSYAPDNLVVKDHPASRLTTARGRLARAYYILHHDGLRALFHRTWRYIQWRISR